MYTLRHFKVWQVVVAASHAHSKTARSDILLKFIGLYLTVPVSYFNKILWICIPPASASKNTKKFGCFLCSPKLWAFQSVTSCWVSHVWSTIFICNKGRKGRLIQNYNVLRVYFWHANWKLWQLVQQMNNSCSEILKWPVIRFFGLFWSAIFICNKGEKKRHHKNCDVLPLYFYHANSKLWQLIQLMNNIIWRI